MGSVYWDLWLWIHNRVDLYLDICRINILFKWMRKHTLIGEIGCSNVPWLVLCYSSIVLFWVITECFQILKLLTLVVHLESINNTAKTLDKHKKKKHASKVAMRSVMNSQKCNFSHVDRKLVVYDQVTCKKQT